MNAIENLTATTLRNVPGVLSVDPDVAYRVAPPDSDVQ